MTCNKLLILACTFCIAIISQAQQVEFHKSIKKSFKITPETSVQISNKYGNIHIVKSTSDSVIISVEIKASDKDTIKATKIFNNVDVQFDASLFYVIAKTSFNEYKGSVWSNISDIANTAINGAANIEINWTLTIPENVELKIDNKFGNIYTTDHISGININLSNGDFQAHNLSGKSNIKVEFGNVKIKNITAGKLELSYVEGEITSAQNLDLYSRSTTLTLPFVSNLEINSRHDKLYVDSVIVLKGEASFSLIKVNKATKNTMLNLKYGSAYFNMINNSTKSIFITSVSTDLYLNYDNSYCSKFESTYRKATLVLPSAFDSFTKVLLDEKLQLFKMTGIIGEPKAELSEIKLNFSSGILSCGIK